LDSGTEAAEEAEVTAPLLVELAAHGLQGTKLRSAGVDERLTMRLLVTCRQSQIPQQRCPGCIWLLPR